MQGDSLVTSPSVPSLLREEIASLAVQELVDMLCKTSNTHDQADILHSLFDQ